MWVYELLCIGSFFWAGCPSYHAAGAYAGPFQTKEECFEAGLKKLAETRRTTGAWIVLCHEGRMK